MTTVLLVIHLIVAVSLICVILLQRTAQDGGGLVGGGGGGSTMGGLFTARGSANLLSRTTAILATIFIFLSLLLGFIASQSHKSASIVDQVNLDQTTGEVTAPASDENPKADTSIPSEAPAVPVSK
ncbi:MAG: preprotein translocase subunit SecG [Proteobacteria bacterium]|jgi:preprotein translocase subunit SecG|nr:preprotein translocase subunit SecG [Alphaproteobacteria bacterium]NCC02512.1 preprotein translocase subunit SecG [Pseudomonadota bacterium]